MYLSGIEIIGFKSFAQRVTVKFDAGVTAIVGPNGCGKTNIVDAIRWALGEQRYSTLRSDKMEDVIFNGTKNRKPLGLAEVSLVIQNTKGILPTEYSEVTITRRVFRSGESEYLLNKVACRLKDILDLFMDTGMGADAYSVIELKMIETILSDKTDERRRLFEEAAGVTKYKHRRKAAYRKLESVQQDLTRVNDIVKEVQKTVSSLERQAKKAEQYNDVSARLKALEIDLLEREYAYLHGKLTPMEEKHLLASTGKQQIDEALKLQEEQLDALRAELSEIERALIQAQRQVATHRESLHKHEEKILVATERTHSLTSNIARYTKEKVDLQAQLEKSEHDHADLQARREQLQGQVEELSVLYREAREEQERASKAFEAKKTEVQSLNDTLLALERSIIEKRGEHERIKGRIDNLQGRIDRSREEIGLYDTDVKKCTAQVAELTARDKELRKQFLDAEVFLIDEENRKKTFKEEAEQTHKLLVERQNELERKQQKIEFLRGLIESGDRSSEAAAYLLGMEKWQRKSFATVADSIETPETHRIAIEAVLGDVANYLIVEKLDDVYAAINELKEQDKGKATFICLERVPNIRHAGKPIPAAGSLKRAAGLITCAPAHRPLIEFLFDRVVLVDSLEQAHEVLAATAGYRCVTPDGQIVTAAGIVRGGSLRTHEGGRIGKQHEIDQIEREIAALTLEIASLKTTTDAKTALHDGIDLAPLKSAVKNIEKEMTSIEMRIAQVEFEKRRAHDGIERNTQEQELLETETRELTVQRDDVVGEIAAQEREKAAHELRTADATSALEAIEHEAAVTSKTASEFEIQLVKMQSELRNANAGLDRNVLATNEITATLSRRDGEITRANGEIVLLAAQKETLETELAVIKGAYETHETERLGIEQTYSEKRNALHAIELKIRDERRQHEDAVAMAHDLEVKIAELRSNIEHLRQRAREEFDLSLAVKTYPDDEFVDFAHLRDEVKNLKDRIRVLGAINFAAFDEFTTESERLTFLTQQRDDLIEAEKTLMSTIEEINATAQRIFLETFTKVRENFIRTFKELFMEGDHCDLRLEEGVDPLEAGIEILAQPRGKRPTSIDLLSGGEKTLTAIALLFAIYLVKPSPFCILDEVDAPLDDSNIDRYTNILKKFSHDTQFIVVTHNKRTMEAAHALYGVTMEEEGISKLVTVRFNEESRVKSATLTAN